MRVSVLGPLQVDGGGLPLGRRDRVTLAALTLRRGTPVRADVIADILWDEQPPPSAAKVVQGCIVRIRKALGAEAIVTTETGYRLCLHHDEVDVAVFEDLVTRSRQLLATGQPDRARFLSSRARSLWRGDPYPEAAHWTEAAAEIDRLNELRRDVEDLDCEAALALGQHHDVVAELTRLVGEEPDREHRWAMLALAQYRSGRQTDALDTLKRARAHLVASLGVEPGPELSTLVGAVLRQDASLDPAPTMTRPDEEICPYPGLAPFEPEDSETFFGRDADVAACLRRLDTAGVVALVGPSGSGKSSVLRAGVAAALLADGRRVEVFTPGPAPMTSLAGRRTGGGTVLVVDQCEEAFTASPDEAQEFLLALVEHVRRGGWLAVGVRGDRVGELSTHAELARLVEDGLILLGPLTEHGLRHAIEGPAAQAGLRVEPGLVELLVHDVLGEPAALPLLSHVLRRTWEQREGRTLTVAGYRATGGVRGAVAQTAEDLFHALTPSEQRAVRELMTRLVGLDDRGDVVRQRVAWREVDGDELLRGEVLDRLLQARLVSLDDDSIDVAHESLAVAWPRLRSWLDEDVEGARIMRHLTVSAQSWATLGRPTSELYRGVRQTRAAEWAARSTPTLSPVERDFLDESAALAAAEHAAAAMQAERDRRMNRRLRGGLAAVGGLLVVALLAGGLAVSASREARTQALASDARRLGAEAMRARDLDTRLLLAASSVALHDDTDTRASLLAALDAAPALTRVARLPSTLEVAVDPRTGHVLVTGLDGLHVRDPDTLAAVAHHPTPAGFSVVAGSTGGGAALVVMPDAVGTGDPPAPAVGLLDSDGSLLPQRLGGIPDGAFGFQLTSLSPDGNWLAASLRIDSTRVDDGADLTSFLGVWDVRSPDAALLALRLDTPAGMPAVVNAGRDLVYLHDGELVVRSLPGGEVTHRRTAEDLRTRYLGEPVAVSPDGELLAVAGAGEVVLVDTANWAPVGHLEDAGTVASIAFSPDGAFLGAGGDELVVWRLGGESPLEVLREDEGGAQIAFSRDGSTLFTVDFADTLLTAWDLTGEHGFLTALPPPASAVDGLPRISPDGRQVIHAATHPRPVLRLRQLQTGAVTPVIDADQGTTSFLDSAWSPDGALVTMSTGVERVSVWNSRTGELRRRTDLPDRDGASVSAFTLDGTGLLVGTTTGRLHLLDSRTLDPLAEPITVASTDMTDEDRVVDNLEPSPDGRVLAMLRAGTFVVDVGTRQVDRLDVTAQGAGWSPDGERVFVTTAEGRVGVLDARTWRWVTEASGAQPFARGAVDFSSDGQQVVTLAGGRVGLFDGHTAEFLGSVTVGDDGIADFAGDGDSVVIAVNSGRVLTWQLDPASWREKACRIAGRALTEQEWREYLPDREHVAACPGS